MPRTTPMFRNDVLTYWTNDKVDSDNERRARSKRGKRAAPFEPMTYWQIWLVFTDRVEPADLTNYQTATESAAHFSDDDFVGLVTFVPILGSYNSETKNERGARRRGDVADLATAVQGVREDFAELAAEQAAYDSDPLHALKTELARADWYYHYSDDGGVFNAGEAHFHKIRALVRQCGQAGADLYAAAEAALPA